ncbi:MAG: hypothetical protein GY831_27180, partial [Delftia sp.]|nr:hypothetical protein [Delftia sp.]
MSERLGELNEEQRHHFRYRVLVNEWLMLGQRRERPDKLVHLTDVFGRRRYLVILGDPGSGKTTLCRWLALQFARAFKDGQPHVLIRRPDQEKAVDLGRTRLPILLRVADYAQTRQDEPDLPLADYLGRQPVQGQAPPLAPETLRALFGDYLEREQAVVLLDGLDEITDPGERNEIVRAIEGFIAANVRAPEGGSMLDDWQARLGQDGAAADLPTLRRRWSREAQPGPAESGGSQVVVTSRVAGYRAAPLRGDLAHFTIQDMDDEAVRRFCERWTLAVERFLLRGEDLDDEAVAQRAASEAAALLDAIQASPGVRKLATNPLLLTILALIHRDQTRLPEQRVQLYQQTVKTLVELWRDTGLSEAEVIDVLGPLALWIHEHQPTGLATEDEVRAEITRALAAWHGHDPARLPGKFKRRVEVFMRAVREQSGLLVARGEGLYGFMHLTFQEYFVARELTRDSMTAIENIQQRLHLPRWREPLLLAVAYLSEAQRGAMDRVMLGLLDAPADYEQTLHRNLLFAAACIPDAVWVPPRYARRIVAELVELYADERAGGRYPTLRAQIEDALRPLRRDDNAARIVDELLTKALADDARCLLVARLVRAADWHTPAVARALLRALPHDAAPDWPLDAGLAQIAARVPEALPADRLPFRAACLAEPVLWEKLSQSDALRALVLALYGAGYSFKAERMYRDSPLTPAILSILRDQDESLEQALVEALEPFLEQDELHYVETQVALVALGQSETVTARLQADAALPQIQPAVRATALRLLDFTRRAAR